MKTKIEIVVCPKCEGEGLGFGVIETCKYCNGRGFITVEDDECEEYYDFDGGLLNA